MSEPAHETSSQSKRDSMMGQIIVAVAVILLVIVGIFAARTGINRKEVEHKIEAMEEGLNHMLRERGYSVAFSYEDLDIGGGLFSKRITIKNPVFQLESDKQRGFYSGMTLSSDRVTVIPSDSEFSEVKLVFPAPMMVEKGRRSWLVSAPELGVIFERETDDGNDTIHYMAPLNKTISIENQESGGKWLLSFHDGSDIQGEIDVKDETYMQESYFTGFLLSQESSFTLEGKNVKWDISSAKQDGALLKEYRIAAESLSFQDEMAPLGTMKLNLNVEENLPERKEGEATVRTHNYELSADAGEYALNSDGVLYYENGNLVPFGELKLSISRPAVMLDALEGSSLITHPMRGLLASGLEFATGRPIDENTDKLQVTMRRSDGGSFIIGRTTFEELAAHVLRGLIDTTHDMEDAEEGVLSPEVSEEEGTAPAAEPTEAEKQMDKIKKNMNDIGEVIESLGKESMTPSTPSTTPTE